MTRLILMRKRPRISIGKSETRPEAMLARYTSESFQGNRLIKREEIVTTLRLRNIIQAAIAIARERIIKWQEGMLGQVANCWLENSKWVNVRQPVLLLLLVCVSAQKVPHTSRSRPQHVMTTTCEFS